MLNNNIEDYLLILVKIDQKYQDVTKIMRLEIINEIISANTSKTGKKN